MTERDENERFGTAELEAAIARESRGDEKKTLVQRLRTVLCLGLAAIGLYAILDLRLADEAWRALSLLKLALVGTLIGTFAYEHERQRTQRRKAATLLAAQTGVLEMIARGAPLGDVLQALAVLVERHVPDMLCSVLLLEGDRLRYGAAPSLPAAYSKAIDGLQIGPEVGSCGTAAYWRRSVVVADVACDPRWAKFRDLALEHGLRACWSAPILAADGSCLGTFAMYYRAPRSPAPEDWHLIAVSTHLAGVAMGRHRTEEALARSTQQLDEESRVSGALVRVGQEMISTLSTPRILERLCQLTTELLQCDCSDTVLRQPEGDVWIPNSEHGYSADERESLRMLRLPSAILAPVLTALERAPLFQVETSRVQDPLARKILNTYGITVALYAALRRGDEIIGLLSASLQRREGRFTPLQQRIALGIAQLASMALENARLVEELERASQLKSEFVSTMSHELRTPLSVIMGYTDMLTDDLAQDERLRTLARIRGSSLELLELIEATLDVSRIEAGKDPARFQMVSVAGLLEELEGEFAAMPRQPGIALHWEKILNLELCTDRRKLKIILKNLISNALKFTRSGSVTVSCRADASNCSFAVRDTGIGIAPQQLPIIFDMFRQADSSDARSYSGVGLGLYIVHRLLTQLGGSVRVDSDLGRGSTFTVTFPRSTASVVLSATG